MKPSRYNHFFPYSDTQSIAYNALSNSLALIGKENLEAYNDFCEYGKELSSELIKDLKKGKFLVEDYVDELQTIRFNMLRFRYNSSSLVLTITPTTDCNFRCLYCLEKSVLSSKYMSEEVQDKLIKMLESYKKVISSFTVVWYGGEPLMAFDVVKKLSKKFIEICDENSITYNASMVTNGYLLSRDILKQLPELKISSVQITIDGLPDVHNRMRPHVDGGETFDVIMNNLINGYDLLPHVALRINVDKSNTTVGKEIYKILEKNDLTEKIKPYYGRLVNDTGSYEQSLCLSSADFSELAHEFSLEITESKNNIPIHYPQHRWVYCCADALNAHCIDAEGLMYRCWADIGDKDKCVGSLMETIISTDNRYFQYMLHDPTIDSKCKDCAVLPLCMGGCPLKRIIGDDDVCSNYKYVLDKCLHSSTRTFQLAREANDTKEKIE